MNTERLLKIMRSREFALRVLDKVESVAGYHFLSLYDLGAIKTIDDWARLAEDNPAQQTTQLTVRFCHDFEYAIPKVLEEHYGYCIVGKEEVLEVTGNYDFAVREPSDSLSEALAFEVKSTQCKAGWTGSTHTTGVGKVPYYVLVQYGIDRSTIVGRKALHGMITDCHFSVTSPTETGEEVIVWGGTASKNNSRTTGKIPLTLHEQYRDMVSLGGIRTKGCSVWTSITREKLHSCRFPSNNRFFPQEKVNNYGLPVVL